MTGPLMPGSILSMPAAAAERLIRLDSGDAALLYLCLTACQNRLNTFFHICRRIVAWNSK